MYYSNVHHFLSFSFPFAHSDLIFASARSNSPTTFYCAAQRHFMCVFNQNALDVNSIDSTYISCQIMLFRSYSNSKRTPVHRKQSDFIAFWWKNFTSSTSLFPISWWCSWLSEFILQIFLAFVFEYRKYVLLLPYSTYDRFDMCQSFTSNTHEYQIRKTVSIWLAVNILICRVFSVRNTYAGNKAPSHMHFCSNVWLL